MDDVKADLSGYLQAAREAVVWKLVGLSVYDTRRPLVPTGTNLLGLVKHVAGIEIGYLGDTFGRPITDPPTWLGAIDSDPNIDMWATPAERLDDVVGLYRRVWDHSDATIAALDLDAIGRVPWWPPDRAEVTLHRIVLHVIAETTRHAGHADIVRELVDGAAGLRPDNDNLPSDDDAWWRTHHARVEDAARQAAGD